MSYKRLEHTADVEVLVEADSLESLFCDSLDAMVEIMGPEKKGDKSTNRTVSIGSIDLTALLIDFLSEVLALSEINNEYYEVEKIQFMNENRVEVVLAGRPIETFSEDIKAVTYHEADVVQDKDGKWSTKIIFDI
ncbi:archease [Candidatus Dojkabacteria bacterium]|nr:archease [Candidatus Dojkabacteria bacterium]